MGLSNKVVKRGRIKLSAKSYRVLLQGVYERDGWRCKQCLRRDNLNAHHIIYRSQGGDDALDNLVTLCLECHKAVHDKNLIVRREDDGSLAFIKRNEWRVQDEIS